MRKNLKRMLCLVLGHVMPAIIIFGSTPLYKQLRNIALNGNAVSVRNLVLERDAAVFTFKEGTFYFLEAVENQFTGAVFIGEGKFTMTPVLEVERRHLKHLTGGPSITETFSKMVLRFTDDTHKEITASGDVRKVSSVSKAESYLKKHRKLMRKGREYAHPNIAASLLRTNIDLRLLADITWPGHGGYFHSFFHGKKYGDMLFTIDPRGVPAVTPEEVVLACLEDKNLGIWVAEHRREFYSGGIVPDIDHRLVDMGHYNIDASTSGRHLDVAVTAQFKALVAGARVIPFHLYPTLRVGAVTDALHGHLPYFQESYEEDPDFAILLPEGLKKGELYTVTFEYRGNDAVADEGGGNFTLVARSTWYPVTVFGDRATFRMSLRTPAHLEVVATGQPVSREIRDDTLISRWKSDIPIKAVGFNYGQFKKTVVKDKDLDITIESYANVNMPDKIKELQIMADRVERQTGRMLPLNLGSLDTVRLMDKVQAEAELGLKIYSKTFGPMPFDRVAITQQPFPNFGQAWPMLVYMPIIAYFSNTHLNQLDLIPALGFIKYVCAHEIGHQWWGHAVGYKSYRSQWISEAFAQLSASLFAEAVYKNAKFIEFWKDLRKQALRKNQKRKCPSRMGSITLGYRLNTGRTGDVTNTAFYAKGAFIAHMLRMLMWDPRTRDKRFSEMLKDFIKTYYNGNASTDDFKRLVEKHITREMDLDGNGKMDWFFNQWVHGTRIPHYELDYHVKPVEDGKFMLSCTIIQSKVNDSFKMRVPIYVLFEKNKLFRLGSAAITGNSSSPEINVKLPGKPKRVFLCALEDVLCTIKGR